MIAKVPKHVVMMVIRVCSFNLMDIVLIKCSLRENDTNPLSQQLQAAAHTHGSLCHIISK